MKTQEKQKHSKKMTAYEAFALSEYLSKWPGDMDYKDVLDALEKGDNEDIIVADDFDYLMIEDLAKHAENLKSRLESNFISIEK